MITPIGPSPNLKEVTPIYCCNSPDLGDNLFTTPIFRNLPGAYIGLPASTRGRDVATIYHHMARPCFSFTEFPNQINDWRADEHKAVRILRQVGLAGADPLPFVIVDEPELVRARELLASIPQPVLVSLTTRIPDTPVGQYRAPPQETVPFIIDALKRAGFTPVIIRPPSNTDIVPGAVHLEADLRLFLACCRHIRRYCGVDSGPLHAMLANGGKVLGLVPASNPMMFPHGMYLWQGDQIWRGRRPRAQYIEYSQIGALPSQIEFLR